MGWAPLVGRPADYLPWGTVGQWLPAPGNGGPSERGGDPRTDQVKKGTTRTPGWQPEETGPTATSDEKVLSNQRGYCTKGRGPNDPTVRREGGPKDPGVAAPLNSAGCRGNCWRVVDSRRGKTDLRVFYVLVYGRHWTQLLC